MKTSQAITDQSSFTGTAAFHGTWCLVLLICFCFGEGAAAGQKGGENAAKVSIEEAKTAANEQEVTARLFGIVNELKSESDPSAAALLQSEIADVLWRFDEPAARAIFRLAFDTVRQPSLNKSSSIDAKARSDARNQSRRRVSALRTILKRYGLHDQKSAAAWLQDFEDDIKAEQKAAEKSNSISQEQAELLAEMALGLVSQDPKEAQRLGLLSLSAAEVPTAFSRLLIALRGRDKTRGDALFRQAIQTMTTNGYRYEAWTLSSLANYGFFADGSPFPDISRADVNLLLQYIVEACGAQAARWRNGVAVASAEQTTLVNFVTFMTSRAVPLVRLNSPDKLELLQTNVGELVQRLNPEQRQQAETMASLSEQRSAPLDENDSIESRVHRAEQEKNSSKRNLLLRNLVLGLMRSDPKQSLEIARKIDDIELRGQTEDDVYLVLMHPELRGRNYEGARKLALNMNDHESRAWWLAEIASRASSRAKDREQAINLLSEAYSMALKSDNTPAKLESLLLIAKEYLRLDQERGFSILSDAVDTTNRLDTMAQLKPRYPPGPGIRVMSLTVVDGKEVSTDDRPSVNSIDFNQVGGFAERDYLRTSALGGDIKDRFFRAKYFIALARSVLHVPRSGPGYERTLEDMIAN